MQNQAPKHKIRKRTLVAETLAEFGLVCWIGLDAQRGREHELADCGGETTQECVERL